MHCHQIDGKNFFDSDMKLKEASLLLRKDKLFGLETETEKTN
jgi:hypothetical protein